MSEKRRDNKGRILRTGESQRADLTYMYRYSTPDGKRKTIYAPTLKELRDKEDVIIASLSNGNYKEESDMTVGELLELLMQQKSQVLRESTIYTYQSQIRRIQKDEIYNQKVTKIRVSTAKAYALRLHESGLTSWHVKNVCCLLRAAFTIACEDDLIPKNPFAFDLKSVITVKKSTRASLSEDEQQQFLDFIMGDKVFAKYLDEVLVLLHTGVRLGEFCALTLDDVDLKARCLTINKQIYCYKGVISIREPKSKSGYRIIPLDDVSYMAFRRIVARAEERGSPTADGVSGFLFVTNRGAIAQHNIYDALFNRMSERFNAKHGTDIRITPHILRHTFCTNLVRAGIDLKSLQYIMGHGNVDLTLNTYTHFGYEDAKKSFAKVVGCDG